MTPGADGGVVDLDSHVYEPPALWDDYVPPDYRPLARAALWHGYDDDGSRMTVCNGEPVGDANRSRLIRQAIWRPGTKPEEIGALEPDRFVPPNPGAWDAAARLADMDAMGIGQSLLFPTLFAEHFPLVRNPDVAAVLARAYNDWLRDLARADPRRLHPVAVLPLQSPLHARRELERVAELGFRAVFLRPMFYDVPDARASGGATGAFATSSRGAFVTHACFRPLWQRIADLDLVACIRPSLGVSNPEATSAGSFVERVSERLGVGHTLAEATAPFQDNALFLTSACFLGLLEDLPGLRLVLCHSGASWLPLALEKAETYLWLEIPGVFMRRERPVCLEPAEVVERHPLLVCFDAWESSVASQPELFAAKAAFGSRYPGHDAASPEEARTLLARHQVPGDTAARWLSGNARQLLRL